MLPRLWKLEVKIQQGKNLHSASWRWKEGRHGARTRSYDTLATAAKRNVSGDVGNTYLAFTGLEWLEVASSLIAGNTNVTTFHGETVWCAVSVCPPPSPLNIK